MLLANTVLAGWTLLALRTHCAEIVRDRDHGEEYDQNASQREQELEWKKFAGPRVLPAVPQPVGGQSQQQPREIEQQFQGNRGVRSKR